MIKLSPSKRSSAAVRFALMVSLGFAISLAIVGQAQAEKISQVDVLVLYTPGAEALYADVNTRINQLVSVTNQIFSDSDVHMQLRLVHSQRVSFSDDAGSFAALKSVTDRVSIGHGRRGDFVTVMAYQAAYKTNNKIYKFSNSEQTDCNGHRCGRRSGGKKGADAAQSLQ
jgi:hypothetical protein